MTSTLSPGESITLEFGGGLNDLTTGHEVTATDDGVTVTFVEPLSWHIEHIPETMQRLGFTDWRPSSPTTMQAALERALRADESLPNIRGQLSFDLNYMGDTVHCYYPPYSFKWPLTDLVAVERPTAYGANHDDWISETRLAFTYATEYESTFEDE